MKPKAVALRLGLLCACLCTSATVARGQAYSIIDLGTFGGPWASSSAINNLGQITGVAQAPGDGTAGRDMIAFRWTEGVGMETLLRADLNSGGCLNMATDINDSGQVVGNHSGHIDGTPRSAYRYTDGVGLEYLGDGSHARGINNHGEVVGSVSVQAPNGDWHRHAFWYTDALGMQDISGLSALASDINDSHEIVGAGVAGSHAFRYTVAGGMEDLGTLGGPDSIAFAINELGQIVGKADAGPACPAGDSYEYRPTRAFIYTPGGGMQGITPEIDPLVLTDGFHVLTRAQAHAINDSGQVVGFDCVSRYHEDWTYAGSDGYSFLWSAEAGLVNLDELAFAGWENLGVTGINNAGQMCGGGYLGESDHPFRLDPIRIPGDGNLDGQVDGLDYILWSNHYGENPASWGDGDYNMDNAVDGLDYIVWSNNYLGKHPGWPGAVPEPAALALLILGGAVMLRHQNLRSAA